MYSMALVGFEPTPPAYPADVWVTPPEARSGTLPHSLIFS